MLPKATIRDFLKRDSVQRLIYGIGLLLWVTLTWDVFQEKSHISSLRISYSTLVLIPAALLIFQIVLNNRVLWSLIFGLFTAYIIFSIIYSIEDFVSRSGNALTPITWTWKELSVIALFLFTVTLIDVILFYAKPKRRL